MKHEGWLKATRYISKLKVLRLQVIMEFIGWKAGYYSSFLKKGWGYIGFGLCVIPSVCSFVRHNFVSAQYLENNFIEFEQILYMHFYWQDLAWDCYASFFLHLYRSYGPWSTPKFCFRSISWEQIDRISPNFICAFIFTRSSLGSLHIIFPTFVPELWPLIYAKILFLLNILRINLQNFTKFYIYIHIDKI